MEEAAPAGVGIDRTARGRELAGLVHELDERLPDHQPEIRHKPSTLRTWVAFAAITLVFVAGGWFVLQPTRDTCDFSETVCAIEDLDIDALLITIPDADLFDVLPAIDEIDPDDRLTLGDVLRMPGIRDLDPTSLISPSEIDRVLNALD